MNDPKPCICGYTHINVCSRQGKYWISDCAKCGMVGTIAVASSRDEAVNEWNERIDRLNLDKK